MKSYEIQASLRTNTGKHQTRELRKQGMVPCVIYGSEGNIHFCCKENDLYHIVYTSDVFLVRINIDGKVYQSIMQDIQFHPVTDLIIHVDFKQVFEDKLALVGLPVTITGSSAGLRAGGKLRQRMRYIKVKGLLKNMPETLPVDITALEIGDFIKIGDLSFENLELSDPNRFVVVGVVASRISKGMELEEPTAVAKEGEEKEGEEKEGAEKEGEEKEGAEKKGAATKDKKSASAE